MRIVPTKMKRKQTGGHDSRDSCRHPHYEGTDPVSTKQLIGAEGLTCILRDSFKNFALLSINFSNCSSLQNIYEGAFSGCEQLQTINFSNCSSLEVIHTRAFYECKQIEEIDLRECVSLREIGTAAFAHCWKLEKILIEECGNLQKIGPRAFDEDYSFQTVQIPASVKEIGEYAFPYCKNLKSPTVKKNAFKGVSALTNSTWGHDISLITDWDYRDDTELVLKLGNTETHTVKVVATQDNEVLVLSWIVNSDGELSEPHVNTNAIVPKTTLNAEDIGVVQMPPGLDRNRFGYNWDYDTIPIGTTLQRVANAKRRRIVDGRTFFALGILQPHFIRAYFDSMNKKESPLAEKHVIYTFTTTKPIRILRINTSRNLFFPDAAFDVEKVLTAFCKGTGLGGWVTYTDIDNDYVLRQESPLPHHVQWELYLDFVKADKVLKFEKEETFEKVFGTWKKLVSWERPDRWIPHLRF